MEDKRYGINKEYAHKRATELVAEDFFWDCTDELSPFGSDEGDMALAEFRRWKKENPNKATFDCLRWTIEDVSESSISNYNEEILDKALIKSQIEDDFYDDMQYVFTVDISVIGTGFGQFVDEGKIDKKNKPLIQLAINRQKIWANLRDGWEYNNEYIYNLTVLERVLKEA